jgi:hypothetical protein
MRDKKILGTPISGFIMQLQQKIARKEFRMGGPTSIFLLVLIQYILGVFPSSLCLVTCACIILL